MGPWLYRAIRPGIQHGAQVDLPYDGQHEHFLQVTAKDAAAIRQVLREELDIVVPELNLLVSLKGTVTVGYGANSCPVLGDHTGQ